MRADPAAVTPVTVASADPDADLWVDPPPPRRRPDFIVREDDEYRRWREETIRRLDRKRLVVTYTAPSWDMVRAPGGVRAEIERELTRELERVARRDHLEIQGGVRFSEEWDGPRDAVMMRAEVWAVPERAEPPLSWFTPRWVT